MKISNITFLLFISLLTLPSCDQIEKKKREREAVKELTQAKSQMQMNYTMTEDGLQIDQEGVEKTLESVKSTADKLGGKTGEAIRVAAEFGREGNELAKKLETWSNRFVQIIDMKSLSEKRDYEQRINDLNEFREFNQQALDFYAGYKVKLSSRLDAIDFKGKERTQFEAEAVKEFDKILPFVTTVRSADMECADLFEGVFTRMKKADSKWGWNTEHDCLIFENDDDLAFFNEKMKEFSKIGERQQKAQREMLDAVRR